jgi:hypothetical protein
LDPDELRADDERVLAVYVSPVATIDADSGAGLFVLEAVSVLEEAGRAHRGAPGIVLSDRVPTGKVVLFPPADPALIGSVNRELEARGSTWRFGDELQGEWEMTDSSSVAPGTTVLRRRRLERAGAGGGTVVQRVAGQPWLVRDGDLIIVASRLQPDWTSLPVSAQFIPFLDLLINRIAARQINLVTAAPGSPVRLPPGAGAVLVPDGSLVASGGGMVAAPNEPGVYFLTAAAGADTVGALEVNHDPRESRLEPASRAEVRAALGDGALELSDSGVDRELFRGARRADLTGPFVLLAIALGVAELVLATVGGGRGAER